MVVKEIKNILGSSWFEIYGSIVKLTLTQNRDYLPISFLGQITFGFEI